MKKKITRYRLSLIVIACLFTCSCVSTQHQRTVEDNQFISHFPKLNIQFKDTNTKLIHSKQTGKSNYYVYHLNSNYRLNIDLYDTGIREGGNKSFYSDRKIAIDMGYHLLGQTFFGDEKWTVIGKLIHNDDNRFYFGYYKRKGSWLVTVLCPIYLEKDEDRRLLKIFRSNAEITPIIAQKVEEINKMLEEMFVITK